MTDPAARIIGLYRDNAARWDEDRPRNLIERAWLERFLDIVPAGGGVLDLGCGMGEPLAAFLAGRGLRITGVDTAPDLLDLARARLPDQEWILGDMRSLALGRRFDGILAWDSFFHLTRDDQRRMFPVFRDHAAPGAALMFTSGPEDGEAFGEMWGETVYHASLSPAEYRHLLESHGFDEVAHRAEDPDCGFHTVWLGRRRS
ncbi:MAG TPA: class I SAM-dependent methyltransferase [Azospirillaceae bacterium]|nr:class I SAM-dependent methyltransferase [Azospirillaceae bacterium]